MSVVKNRLANFPSHLKEYVNEATITVHPIYSEKVLVDIEFSLTDYSKVKGVFKSNSVVRYYHTRSPEYKGGLIASFVIKFDKQPVRNFVVESVTRSLRDTDFIKNIKINVKEEVTHG